MISLLKCIELNSEFGSRWVLGLVLCFGLNICSVRLTLSVKAKVLCCLSIHRYRRRRNRQQPVRLRPGRLLTTSDGAVLRALCEQRGHHRRQGLATQSIRRSSGQDLLWLVHFLCRRSRPFLGRSQRCQHWRQWLLCHA